MVKCHTNGNKDRSELAKSSQGQVKKNSQECVEGKRNVGNSFHRIDALEKGLQNLQEIVQANHEDITRRIDDLRMCLTGQLDKLQLQMIELKDQINRNHAANVLVQERITNQMQKVLDHVLSQQRARQKIQKE